MSDGESEDKESKTEEPTHKKLQDAISEGQVVNSKEVTSFAILLLLTIVTIWILPYSIIKLTNKLKFILENIGSFSINNATLYKLMTNILNSTLVYLSPVFLIVFIAVITSSYFQHGQFVFSGKSIIPKLSKISIIAGFKRIFSMKSFVEFLKGIFKIGLIGIFVLLLIFSDIKELTNYQELSISGILDQIFNIIKDIMILVTLIMSVIAFVDFAYQKYEYLQNLRMTKQELKEEYKQTEGNPEIKSKLRKLRRENTQRIIKANVPNATVIITNPEHYAVALEYDANTHSAPICIAKGVDLIAKNIKTLAEQHNIPIVESPPLARALYKDVDYAQPIPVEHFEEVASIISYVMALEQKAKAAKLK